MAVSYTQLIVRLSDCDLISMRVVIYVKGFTMDAPSVRFLFSYPSVHTKLYWIHATWTCFMGLLSRLWAGWGIYG